jgi:hypothetical protein
MISSLCTPNSVALRTASSAATWAAYGVDFVYTLKPTEPPDFQTNVYTFESEMLIIVLLKLAFMWATPEGMFFLFFFFDLVSAIISLPFSYLLWQT